MRYPTFPFGRYKGCSISQTALSIGSATEEGRWGYAYLRYVYNTFAHLDPHLRKELKRHIEVLNEFKPIIPCYACKAEDPSLISLSQEETGWVARGPYVYCKKDDCTQSIQASNYKLVPLGFDALLEVNQFHRQSQRDSHATLRALAGWKDGTRVTESSAWIFINQLEYQNTQRLERLARERKETEEQGVQLTLPFARLLRRRG